MLVRSRNLIVIRARGLNKKQNVSYGFLGKNGMMFVHCYTDEGHLDAWLPRFNAIAQSAKYEDDYQFVPGIGRPFGMPWLAVSALGLLVLIVLIGLIALTVKGIRMQKSKLPTTGG
jgi:hypothetical protein